jgi:hypothetical protein
LEQRIPHAFQTEKALSKLFAFWLGIPAPAAPAPSDGSRSDPSSGWRGFRFQEKNLRRPVSQQYRA